ncbi:MAG: GNAT family N-acetyltransferase [Christensenellaceae bacterium]|jgi:ribosomal protein S18 acetylase RimI-like enzyme
MKVEKYQTIEAFEEAALPYLLQDEVKNNLMIGKLMALPIGIPPAGYFLAALYVGETIALVCFMDEKARMLLATEEEIGATEIAYFIDACKQAGISPASIFAAPAVAEQCSVLLQKREAKRINRKLYCLERVAFTGNSGEMRLATGKDIYFIPYWLTAMDRETLAPQVNLAGEMEEAKTYLAQPAMHILEVDHEPVCMGAFVRALPQGRYIGSVYTPPMYRGRGYATSLVSQMAEKAFFEEAAYVALFADAENGAANRIYERIGFQHVFSFLEIRFAHV